MAELEKWLGEITDKLNELARLNAVYNAVFQTRLNHSSPETSYLNPSDIYKALPKDATGEDLRREIDRRIEEHNKKAVQEAHLAEQEFQKHNGISGA